MSIKTVISAGFAGAISSRFRQAAIRRKAGDCHQLSAAARYHFG